jgi:hypothetical protein
MCEIEINAIYKHYKGKHYKVLAIGKHSETKEELVVYQGLYDNYPVWCRPKSMWNDLIELNGKMIKRFEKEEEYNGQI